MANTNIGISNFVYSQAPFFVKNDHPTFIKFVEAYYEYLEQEGKTVERAKGFRHALDVDENIDLYSEKLYSQFLALLPEKTIADRDLIIKHVKDFYRARGSEKSVEFLLSVLYDLDTNFYYPKRDILKASDGKWFQEKSLKVLDIKINDVPNNEDFAAKKFASTQIRGLTSNATATVETVDVYYESGVIVKELKISNQVRDFSAGETITAQFVEEGMFKNITANVFSGIIARVDVIEKGTNYSVGQVIPVESDTGSGGVIIVSSVSRSGISRISPTDGGAGFQALNGILVSSSDGFGANAVVGAVNTNESVHPNSYNVIISTIDLEVGTIIANVALDTNETFAYGNLAIIPILYTPNTSNLIANTTNVAGGTTDTLWFSRRVSDSNVSITPGTRINAFNTQTSTWYNFTLFSTNSSSNIARFYPSLTSNVRFNRLVVQVPSPWLWSNITFSTGANTGNPVAYVNLSSWKANSNIYFETGDTLWYSTSNVTIIKSNLISNSIIVTPGLPHNLTDQPFRIFKRANVNTRLDEAFQKFTYADTGPIESVIVISGGNNYTGDIQITAEANSRVRALGILGKMRIDNPGRNYANNDEIVFNSPSGIGEGGGTGAKAFVERVNSSGSIMSVKFKAMAGHYTGGSGYSKDYLPTANVISAAGIGAVIVPTAILGYGEKLVSSTEDVGAIQSLRIVSGGSGYASPPLINLKSFGSGTAQAVATIVQGVFTYPGRYLNDDGHLSSFNFIQDGKYYHNYSYVVRIKQAINNYRKTLKDLVHPAGMSLFGEYTFEDQGDTLNVQVSTAKANITPRIVYSLNTRSTFSNVITLNMNTSGYAVNSELIIDFAGGNLRLFNVDVNVDRFYVTSVVNANAMRVSTGTKLPGAVGTISYGGNASDLYFKPDGTKLFILDDLRANVVSFTLSRPWDLSSAIFETISNIQATSMPITDPRIPRPTALYFKPDGTGFYTSETAGGTISNITFFSTGTNPWNVNTISRVASINIADRDLTAAGIMFNPQGNIMILATQTFDGIQQYELSTPWDLTTATWQRRRAFTGQMSNPTGIYSTSTPNGNRIFVVGNSEFGGSVQVHSVTNDWNIANTIRVDVKGGMAALAGGETAYHGVHLSENGNVMYLIGRQYDLVYQMPLLNSYNVNSVVYFSSSLGTAFVAKAK